MATTDEKMILLVNDHHGVYVPKMFCESFNQDAWHVRDEDQKILKGDIGQEGYWDTWASVCDSAYFIAEEGNKQQGTLPGKWTLHQEGDLWAIHESFTDQEWAERF